MTSVALPASASSKHLKCKNLHEYLRTLPHEILEQVYRSPATCLAVFRDLPKLGKHFVMRLLFVEQPVVRTVISSWVSQNLVKEMMEAFETLTVLRIWSPIKKSVQEFMLNPTFQKNLRVALLKSNTSWTLLEKEEPDPYPRTVEFLDKYAMERWECMLHYMVDCQQQEGVSAGAIKVLLHAGLMRPSETDGTPAITADGFQFLLLDTPSQVWYFMLEYLGTLEARGMNLTECLNFLFQLSFSTLGMDYSTDGLSETTLGFLQHLREFGLVYQRKRSSGRFYPTRLALNIARGHNKVIGDGHRPGYIMLETNYRVYAYTDSELQIALLGIFSEVMCRFPNLTVCVLTRESVREALRSGITADQILSFLRLHAHPQMLKHNPVIPPTIADQIRLWEIERDRFTFAEGVLYNHFLSQSDFELLRNYSRDLGVLIWDNEQKRTMVVTRVGHDDVKRFWKRQSRDRSGPM